VQLANEPLKEPQIIITTLTTTTTTAGDQAAATQSEQRTAVFGLGSSVLVLLGPILRSSDPVSPHKVELRL